MLLVTYGFMVKVQTLLGKAPECRVEWIEHQLAYSVKDTNGKAYNRTSF